MRECEKCGAFGVLEKEHYSECIVCHSVSEKTIPHARTLTKHRIEQAYGCECGGDITLVDGKWECDECKIKFDIDVSHDVPCRADLLNFFGIPDVIFEWELPSDHPNFTGADDLPEKFRVIENVEASGGIVIEARVGGIWGRPWNIRPLVRELLRLLGDKPHDS